MKTLENQQYISDAFSTNSQTFMVKWKQSLYVILYLIKLKIIAELFNPKKYGGEIIPYGTKIT